MSPVLDTSVESRLTSQGTPRMPQPQQKRKREEAGDSEARAASEKKRSRIKRSSAANPKNSQAQTTEVVKSAPKVVQGKDGDHANRSKATMPSVVSEKKLAKRERRKARREQESNSHNHGGEENMPNGTSHSSLHDASSQGIEDQGPTARRRKHRGNESQLDAASTWKLSEPVGGRFLDIEPLFSADEKYVPSFSRQSSDKTSKYL